MSPTGRVETLGGGGGRFAASQVKASVRPQAATGHPIRIACIGLRRYADGLFVRFAASSLMSAAAVFLPFDSVIHVVSASGQ